MKSSHLRLVKPGEKIEESKEVVQTDLPWYVAYSVSELERLNQLLEFISEEQPSFNSIHRKISFALERAKRK